MSRRKKGKQYFITALLWAVTLLFAAPFYILIIYAFKPREATMLKSPLAFPDQLYLDNFSEAIEKSKFFSAFKNSLISTTVGVILLVLICSMAAYVIIRKGSSFFYAAWQYVFLAAIMLPFQTVMFPLYKNLVKLGILNTLFAYILVSVGFQMGFAIFLYCGFIKTVPIELEEAARIDGCGVFSSFWKIVFPLLKPVTMTVVVLSALGIWNDYQIALVVIMKDSVRTLPVAQQSFIGQQISYLNLASAACLLSIIPMFLLYLFLQKFIVKGIVAGAVKG
ncbi:MAG: carbohydrate ABC transporter permease [Lachnospiraceae bacterium]|nr:carbohydrate ABC transporter permease [Lachnospiraceae bacterium]